MSGEEAARVPSPCTGVCRLNRQDCCIGCGRTGLEIAEWGVMNNAEKQAVLVRIKREETASR
ncbi:DUF1289 domain-containing protein [Motiliproteus sp. SC1-56]|uniref:DUF1289 domain-containing protein n=1 Tax=Motiliproteus sp. SC1-56 TaxID=2799565 RepID=UPI001A8C8739|nr:DUF1289 domain-containing protein [Motiliproteus sp. SC1-56]